MAELIHRFLPDPAAALRLGPAFLAFVLVAAAVAARLRSRRGLAAPYTRKVFHFEIFTAATVVQLVWGLGAATLYGLVVVLVVLGALWRGTGHPFYEALARPTDRPHRTLFILVPLASTAVGGVASNLLFGPWAAVGYLVCGWGDALGEPVGVAWGRHPYSVPSLFGVPARRSLEGSAAVTAAGWLAATLALLRLGQAPLAAAAGGLACGVAGGIVEAVSHHGLDNLTIQVAASGVAAAWPGA